MTYGGFVYLTTSCQYHIPVGQLITSGYGRLMSLNANIVYYITAKERDELARTRRERWPSSFWSWSIYHLLI